MDSIDKMSILSSSSSPTKVLEAGGGNYQTLMNQALRELIEADTGPLEERIRKVIREELRQVSEPR